MSIQKYKIYDRLEGVINYTELVKNNFSYFYGEEKAKVYVHSYGCLQSVADGEKLKGILIDMGYESTDDLEKADVILYNTCAVRENAEDRVFGNVGVLKALKRENKNLIIGIAGCMTEQDDVKKRIQKSYPYVDLIMGSNDFDILPRLVYERLSKNKKFVEKMPITEKSDIIENVPTYRDDKIKANVSIMYGCDNFCSYCIVPYVRGRERSRSSEEIISEVRDLVNNGYKEIMLLGENVNSYGKGLDEDIDFPRLLRKINAIEGDFWIRFMSSHPKDCSRELIDTMADCEKIERHIHLPVQSGSNSILKVMNRRYTVEHYSELIAYARQKLPTATISTDLIVGFPNETREDFEKTLDLIKSVKYDAIYSFIYSKRTGTVAAKIEDTLADKEKSDRMCELLDIQNEILVEKMQSYVGKEQRVLIDTYKPERKAILGRDSGGVLIEIKEDRKDLLGQFVDVKITSAKRTILFGKIV